MKNTDSMSNLKLQFPDQVIPKAIYTKVKIVFFILGLIQNSFYYVILVSLNDLEEIFHSKSAVIICLG